MLGWLNLLKEIFQKVFVFDVIKIFEISKFPSIFNRFISTRFGDVRVACEVGYDLNELSLNPASNRVRQTEHALSDRFIKTASKYVWNSRSHV